MHGAAGMETPADGQVLEGEIGQGLLFRWEGDGKAGHLAVAAADDIGKAVAQKLAWCPYRLGKQEAALQYLKECGYVPAGP